VVELLKSGEELAKIVRLGQVAQTGRVGGADVDDKKISKVLKEFEGGEVVERSLVERGDF
jgi:hypothetical protein